jgi:hypothetical protein
MTGRAAPDPASVGAGPSVNGPLPPNRRPRPREAPELAGAVERFCRSLVRRCAEEGDADAFAALAGLADTLDGHVLDAVAALRAAPWALSWEEIGQASGRSRQGAQQRWRRAGPGARRPGGQPAHLRTPSR